jgi:uncharacterized membrane protein (UPF0127 family)
MAAYQLMSATNATRGSVVVTRGRIANGLLQRVLGLHMLPRLKAGEGLLLRGSTTIDTTFMGYPIDLVFVDRDHRVTRVVHNLAPWRMVLSGHGGHDCLELPAGAAASSRTEAGDQLVFADLVDETALSDS